MKQQNDLIQTYRKRQDEYNPTLPKGGWERLEAELASTPVSVRRKLPYRWMTVAAVALLCVVVSLTWFMHQAANEGGKADGLVVTEAARQSNKQDRRKSIERKYTTPDQISGEQPLVAQATGEMHEPDATEPVVETTVPGEQPAVSVPADHRPVAPVATDHRQAGKQAKRAEVGPQPETSPLSGLPAGKETGKQRPAQRRWAVGLLVGSNAMAGADDQLIMHDPTDSNPGDGEITDPGEEEEDPDNPDDETKIATKAVPSPPGRTDGSAYGYEHKIPLSVGFMLRREFSDRFAVESGLSYTYLYSDIRKGHIPAGNQKVHYLGVPLHANWIFYRQGRFAAYFSAGAMVEYSLSARIELEGTHYSPEINRWQWSLNMAAGMQYALAKPVSLFLEPGINYYFDNNEHNAFETIRTAKPLTVSLQLGLRFSY